MHELVRLLVHEQAEGRFRFLLIGGYGLQAHKIQRDTLDIDFLIASSSVPAVEHILLGLGYLRDDLNNLCGRYRHPFRGVIPVDLLLVNDATLEKLWADSHPFDFLEFPLRTPSVAGYIALKLHAIKWNSKRFGKDASDIVSLMALNPEAVTLEDLKELCEKFGPAGVFEKLNLLLS